MPLLGPATGQDRSKRHLHSFGARVGGGATVAAVAVFGVVESAALGVHPA